MLTIEANVINLLKRTDRKTSIVREFEGREEFRLNLISAIEHQVGGIGLWNTICGILKQSDEEDLDYVVICEDDHVFTSHYSVGRLREAIAAASKHRADILLGGVSWLNTCIPADDNIFWVEKFSGLQFAVFFKGIYHKILNSSFGVGDAADYKISSISDQIYFMFPFISTQKSFGYSDVTLKNNLEDRVEKLFLDAAERVLATEQVIFFYRRISLGLKCSIRI